MKHILWTQGASSDLPSTFVIDGAVCKEESLTTQAYNKLCLMDNNQTMHKKVVKYLIQQSIIPSKQFKLVYKKEDGIFFKSVYKSQDDQGRNIAYMFYSKSNNIEQAYECFEKYSHLADRNLWGEERKVLYLLFNLKKYIAALGLLTLTTATILLIWKHMS